MLIVLAVAVILWIRPPVSPQARATTSEPPGPAASFASSPAPAAASPSSPPSFSGVPAAATGSAAVRAATGPAAAFSPPLLAPSAAAWQPAAGSAAPANARVLGTWTTPVGTDGRYFRSQITQEVSNKKSVPLTIQTVETVDAASGTVLKRTEARAGRALVKLAPGADISALEAAAQAAGVSVGRRLGDQGWYELVGPEGDPGTVDRLLAAMADGSKPVVAAEPDYIYKALATPNDPKYLDGSLWGLHNTGQNSGTADADIDAPEAWDVRRDASNVIVAVIDTGINYDHEDLRDNLWTNPGEIPGNGIDDDSNGYVDDVYGINSITGTGDPRDDHGHGSHCSGTIGARGDNNKGIAGVAWNVKIMGLKFLSASGSGASSDAIECVEYARKMGANILSNSWGGGAFSTALRDTITATRNAGRIFVAAAANNSSDNDTAPVYPASYDVDNIVAVAATTRTDALASYSNFGQGTVHIAAPGSDILSASHADNAAYVTMSGTSMATPQISGIFALLRAQYPSDTYAASINRLLNSTDVKSSLVGKVSTRGRANLQTALTTASPRPFQDNFAAPAVISGSSINVRTTNLLATAESGEPAHAGVASATTTLWYSWTAPSTGTFVLNTQNSLIDTVVAVYTGTALNALTPVVSNDDYSGNTWSRVEIPTTIGTTYRIAIAGKSGAQGLIRFALSGPPGEDNLANAINLPAFPEFASGSNVNAGKESGEPNHAGNAGGASIWVKWTSTYTGPVIVHTTGSTIDTLLAVYSGPASAPTYPALTLVGENDDYSAAGLTTSLVRFNATSGVTYYFATDGKNGAQGAVRLALFPAIANDNFADRSTLTGAPVNVDAPDTGYATRESSEPDHGGLGGRYSLWYSWTAPATGSYQVDTEGSMAYLSLSVYTGSSLNALTPVGSGYLNGGFGNSRVILNATAGTTYAIALDNPDAQFGSGKLNIKAITVAPNNAFAAATTISGTPTLGSPIVVTGHNTGADHETGEPDSSPDSVLTSVWWKWTAPTTARFTLTTEGSAIDTILGVYTGSSVNALTKIAEDDDSGTGLTSRLAFDATAGTTYSFRVYGFAGATGNLTLNLETWQPVANDSFSTPVVFTGANYRHVVFTTEATAETGEPAHAGTAASRSVWFTYTATANGSVTLATDGSGIGTRVAVYTGNAINALTEVASNTAYHSLTSLGQVTWQATAGTTYRIAVDSDTSSGGMTVVSLLLGPANDHFANRTVLGSVSSYSETTYNHGASKETGEPSQMASTYTAKTLWWSWTAPSTGQWEISTEGSSRHYAASGQVSLDTLLGVFTGSAVNSLTSVASHDDIDDLRGVYTSRVILNATAGTTYQICVGGAAMGTSADHLARGEQGEIKFAIKPFIKAANDNFASATTIGSSALPAFFETSNLGLGIETGEPGTANNQTSNYDATRSKGTIWWKWTAPTTARYHAATGGVYDIGRTQDTILSVYSGPNTGANFSNISLLAFDKDSAGAGYSTVSFDATAGQTYYFQVGAASRGKLQFLLAPTAPNDAFAAATLIHGSSATVTGHNLGATFESAEPLIDSSFYPKYTVNPPRARSVWWRWTAPASGTVTLDTLGSSIFSVMAVYTGNAVNALNLVAKNDDLARDPYNGNQPRLGCAQLSFSAVAGVTYSIQVEGGFSDWPSTGLITLALNQPAAAVTPPYVSVAANPATAVEGGAPGRFLVSRTVASNNPLNVSVSYSGSATNGSDYESLPTTVTIPAGAYAAELSVTAFEDGRVESNSPESVVLTVQPGAGYQLTGSPSATVGIIEAQSFAATAPVLTVPAIGANSLGLAWTFPPSDHTHWRLQTGIATPASQYIYEPFNYPAASTLIGSGAWIDGGAGTGNASMVDDNLSSSGFADPVGRRLYFNNNTRVALLPFTSPGSVTDVFYSFLLRLDDVTSMSTSWNLLTRLQAGSTNGPALFVRKSAVGAYDLGIHKRANGGGVETSTSIQNLTSGTTYLVVARYRTVSGTNNDAMDLWINPATSSFGSNASVPTPAFSSVAGSDTTADWTHFYFSAPANAIGTMDELRIGSDWAAVTHLPWDVGVLLNAADTGATLANLASNSSQTYRLRAENGSKVSTWSNTASPTTTATATATDWLVQHFNTAFAEGNAAWNADPDGDGFANILERALGTQPGSPASRPFMASQVADLKLQITFTPLTTQGLRYIIEASSDLQNWSQTDVTSLLTNGIPYVHTDSANYTTSPRRFLRLRVEVVP
ncbi:MAG: hypothetical protein Fur0032_10000 [Terrimicrobiaceae bacterium]